MAIEKTPEPSTQAEAQTMDELRIVLFGPDTPKKQLLNIILNPDNKSDKKQSKTHFSCCCCSCCSEEEQCKTYNRCFNGKKVLIIDTPGLGDLGNGKNKVLEEIKWSVALAEPGPHVFLFVETIDEELYEYLTALKNFQRTFGEQANDFTMVVFTTEKEANKTEKKNIQHFRELTYPFNHRYFIFSTQGNDQSSNPQGNNQDQKKEVTELFGQIAKMWNKDSHFYTPKMLWEAEKAVKQRDMETWVNTRDRSYVVAVHIGATIGFCISTFFEWDSSLMGAVGSIVAVMFLVAVYCVKYLTCSTKPQPKFKKEKKTTSNCCLC